MSIENFQNYLFLAFLDYQDSKPKVNIYFFLMNSPPQVEKCFLMKEFKLSVAEKFQFENLDVDNIFGCFDRSRIGGKEKTHTKNSVLASGQEFSKKNQELVQSPFE